MTASPSSAPGPRPCDAEAHASLVSPVVDYEPPPVGMSVCRSTPVLRRRTPRPSSSQRAVSARVVRESDPPHSAVAFTDAALRRVLEVIDRRRPVAQLRTLLAPALIDTVIELSRSSRNGCGRVTSARTVATLRRMRLRMVDGAEGRQAEVFGTYTSGPRVRALAARIELDGDRWRIVALQVG